MKRYCCGFMFDDEKRRVCLVRKNRPDWQRGLLNGVGGHIEEGESALGAMVREFEEETGVDTHSFLWHHVCTLRFPDAEVEFFSAANSYYLDRVRTTTDEEIEILAIDSLCGVIENIPALVELSLQRLSF